jgi:lactoylglutathione lyase
MYVTGLVNLYTRDIEVGLHCYRDLLGFAETFRTPDFPQLRSRTRRPARG